MSLVSGVRRLRIHVTGVVQGVGFRPFVWTTATRCHLTGWVRNRPDGVEIEAQGNQDALSSLLRGLAQDAPRAAVIRAITTTDLAPLEHDTTFVVAPSALDAERSPSVPADLAVCNACLAEVLSPLARRFRYPFTNCTHCGPRYTILDDLPYDRARTSMRSFAMCPACLDEYTNPADRRFHAQPIACPACGPKLTFVDTSGSSTVDGALEAAASMLRAHGIVAVKGLGGFQLLTLATSDQAVQRLRLRKRREEKPFAVLFQSLESVHSYLEADKDEVRELVSSASPIVLLRSLTSSIAPSVAPANPWIGAMLPTTPLHRLLADLVEQPLVCTSGNLTDEPMCTDNDDARGRLATVADGFLLHDRPIVRPVDDSVVRLVEGRVQTLRRARGFAPLALPLAGDVPLLALGGHLKSTVALAFSSQVVLSPHLGDLDSTRGGQLLEDTVRDLLRFFDVRPEVVACDGHPDYASTVLAEELSEAWGARLERVQHHHAHAAACLAEHGVEGPVLAITWDGAGLGLDGTLWGGEALWVDGAESHVVAWFPAFPLPGGARAFRSPRRVAFAWLTSVLGAQWSMQGDFPEREIWGRVQGAARIRSVGRLFDAVAYLALGRSESSFEGQAAMELETAAMKSDATEAYPVAFERQEGVEVVQTRLLAEALLAERVAPECKARRFHQTLVEIGVHMARLGEGIPVVLTGGCFQNALLLGLLRGRLEREGFRVLVPERVPPNDGGLSLGQAWVARRRGEVSAKST